MGLYVACQDTLAIWKKKKVVKCIATIFAKFTLFYKFWKFLEFVFFSNTMCPLSQILLSTNQERKKFKHAIYMFCYPT